MKLDKVQLYQKVDFEGSVQGHFLRERDPNKRQSQLDMHYEDGLVFIASDKDSIIIPVTNVAIMKKSVEEVKPKSTKKS